MEGNWGSGFYSGCRCLLLGNFQMFNDDNGLVLYRTEFTFLSSWYRMRSMKICLGSEKYCFFYIRLDSPMNAFIQSRV